MEIKSNIKTEVKTEVVITINEGEVRALNALTGYCVEAFIKVFYEHLGEYYMKPHERSLERLFDKFKELNSVISQIDELKDKIK